MENPLQKAVDITGGQTSLAKLIKVRQSHVWNWLNRSLGVVPAEYCIKIEQATNSAVTRYELRPDVFGASADRESNQIKEAA